MWSAGGRGNIREIMTTEDLMQEVKFPNERITEESGQVPHSGEWGWQWVGQSPDDHPRKADNTRQ